MKFIDISDIHLVSKESLLNGSIPSKRLEKCLDDILKYHSDAEFCVISGDLSEFAEKKAYQSLKNRLQEFPIPFFLMIGNHDDRDVFQTVFQIIHAIKITLYKRHLKQAKEYFYF